MNMPKTMAKNAIRRLRSIGGSTAAVVPPLMLAVAAIMLVPTLIRAAGYLDWFWAAWVSACFGAVRMSTSTTTLRPARR